MAASHRGRTRVLPLRRNTILTMLEEAEIVGLTQVAEAIESKAKAKAPVRKIYDEGGKRRRSRAANSDLLNAAIRNAKNNKRLSESQRASALYLLERYPQEARVAIRRHGSVNRRKPTRLGGFKRLRSGHLFTGLGTPLLRTQRGVRAQRGFEPTTAFDSQLSARGRYEIRSGRALTNEAGQLIEPGSHPTQVFVGGRLKKSITTGAPKREGTRLTVSVSAPVPYAKYVEFPTRHNAAQPFLLPALHEEKQSLEGAMENALRAKGLKG